MTARRAFLSCGVVMAAALVLTVSVAAAQTPESPAAEAVPAEPESPVVEAPHDTAQPPQTLMFTLQERLSIEAALRAGGLGFEEDAEEPALPRLRQPLYLSGLLYEGRGAWTIWINGQAMCPGDTGALFSIAAVDATGATLAVAWGDTTRLVRLQPNQTFRPAFADVVEGKAF